MHPLTNEASVDCRDNVRKCPRALPHEEQQLASRTAHCPSSRREHTSVPPPGRRDKWPQVTAA
jgi:hypothetical protein